MSAAIPRPPGPATTWWIREPMAGGPSADISLTPGRQLRSLFGSVKKANTPAGVAAVDHLALQVRHRPERNAEHQVPGEPVGLHGKREVHGRPPVGSRRE